MIIRTLITAVLTAFALPLTLRYNMHMLQLNGYKNDEHLRWMKKNIRMQWILLFLMALGLLRVFFAPAALDILVWLTLLVTALVYRQMKLMATKKKLVWTPRVKRMTVTILLLGALLLIGGMLLAAHSYVASGAGNLAADHAGYFASAFRPAGGILPFLVGAQLLAGLLTNLVNRPIEKGINHYYIRDAKRKLRSVPGLKVIGVTGSYGKTSVKFYLQTLLRGHFNVLVTPESYNTPMGVVKTIRASLKPTTEIFVCEMGARRVGDIRELCEIVHPDHGILTAIGPQHLETFGDLEHIRDTKFELADAVPSSGMIFLNGDNEIIREKGKQYPNAIYYRSESEGEGYYASDISVSNLGTDFTVHAPDGSTQRYQMHLIGAHNVINVVGAIAVAHALGVPLKELVIPVRQIQPVAHRMQLLDRGAVTIIDDAYNSNPVGSKAAVETLALFDGVRILITPGMVELGEQEEEYNRLFGTYAADCCDYILLVGRKRAVPIREGALGKGFDEKRCRVFDHLEDALSYAYSIRDEGHKYILLENDLPDNY